MQEKDYKRWTELKVRLHRLHLSGHKIDMHYNEGDVFWASLGENIGFEEDGKGDFFLRPVVVVRGINKALFYGVPCTTTLREGFFFISGEIHGRRCTFLLNQITRIDIARVKGGRYDRISAAKLKELKQKISTYF